MMSQAGKRLFAAVAAIAAIWLSWAFLWPAQFGGQASWLVVEGSQLEPFASDGDLVIARELDTYAEGTLVAVAAADGPMLSVMEPETERVLGAPWLQVAGLGGARAAAASFLLSGPILLAAVLAAVAAAVVRRRRQRAAAPAEQRTATAREDLVLAS